MTRIERPPTRRTKVSQIGAFVAALCALIGAGPGVADELDAVITTPVATIESLQRGLVDVAAADLTVEERYARLAPLIAATHDLEYIAALVVRRQWDTFDADQRARYLAAFARLSVMNYASRFAGVAGDSFLEPTTQSSSADSAAVASGIRARDGDEISFDYALRHSERGWRIVNIVADGVSDLALKRAEYRRILTDGSPEDLIEALGRQIDDLAKGGG
jgi:phospholipid transport system substrate-binding protein